MKNTLKLFPLTVTLLLCISTAAGLKCFSCSGSACHRDPVPIKQCGAGETRCMTRTPGHENPDTKTVTTEITKGCAYALAVCLKDGKNEHNEWTESGLKKFVYDCCSGDFCNGDTSSVQLVVCDLHAAHKEPSTMSVIQPMMCMFAKVKENPEGPTKEVKGVAGAPLCSKPGDFTYIYGPKTIEVKCCNSNSCNSGLGVEVEVPGSVQSCDPPNYCSLGLHMQLQGLSQGQTLLAPSCCDHV